MCLKYLPCKEAPENLVDVDPLEWPTEKLVCDRLAQNKGVTL